MIAPFRCPFERLYFSLLISHGTCWHSHLKELSPHASYFRLFTQIVDFRFFVAAAQAVSDFVSFLKVTGSSSPYAAVPAASG